MKQALEMALEALQVATTPLAKDRQEVLRAITAIKQALAQPEQHTLTSRVNDVRFHKERDEQRAEAMRMLAQPEQEPVASIFISGIGEREFDDWGHDLPVGRNLLYTTPPQPEQEPVAWIEHHKAGDNLVWDEPSKGTPLYTKEQL